MSAVTEEPIATHAVVGTAAQVGTDLLTSPDTFTDPNTPTGADTLTGPDTLTGREATAGLRSGSDLPAGGALPTGAAARTGSGARLSTDTGISVVIPALNEARNIGAVLRAMPPYVAEVVLVDGNSQDGTVETAYHVRPDIKVVRQSRQGKGNALAAGFNAATGRYVVMIDADGSMDPGEIGRFVMALEAGADYVKGSRFVAGGGTEDITRLRMLGNSVLNALTNLLFRTRYSDLCYGFNAFRRECLPVFGLAPPHLAGAARWGDGFEIETVLNTRAARAKIKVAEVASFEHRRMFGTSHLRTFRDGARVLAAILRERLAWSAPVSPTDDGRPRQ